MESIASLAFHGTLPFGMSDFPTVDVEKEFSMVVRSCGGVVLSDVLDASPSFNNADYHFPHLKVVAELKCLTEDHSQSAASKKRLDDVWQKWKAEGKVQGDGVNELNWKQLPKELQTEIYKVTSRPIVKRVQKANKQIRETKDRLNLADHRGLLLIVNDGKSSFSPAATIHAVVMALQSDFRHIREFVFFTVNQFSRIREMPVPTLFWIHLSMDDPQEDLVSFVKELGEKWRNHHHSLLGVPAFAKELEDMEGFWHSRYKPEGH